MNIKIIGIFVCALLISNIIPVAVMAGDEKNPEITDEEENDVQDNLNIISAWFFEKEEEPGYLYTALKLKNIDTLKLKQHLVVIWEHNGVHCSAGLYIGYDLNLWCAYEGGNGHGLWFNEHYQRIEGEFDEETGIIICKTPKSIINNPEKGDVLTNTRALAFQRFGFIGRMGFDRCFIQSLIYYITGKSVSDYAPNDGYGLDYIIQY
jgi:hypothetical protein